VGHPPLLINPQSKTVQHRLLRRPEINDDTQSSGVRRRSQSAGNRNAGGINECASDATNNLRNGHNSRR
jgi:hypothetical protein